MARTASLPLSLAGVSVSFDVPGAGIHVPGRRYFGQWLSDYRPDTVGVDWLSSAVMKVTLSNSQTKTVRPEDANLSTNQSQVSDDLP